MTVQALIAKLNDRIEQGQASDRAVAQAAGVTVEQFSADTTEPDHSPHSRHGRQTCCGTCHECGTPLRECMDGEMWCPACELYR